MYKTPEGRVYDPWSVLKLWVEQEAEVPNRDRFWNLYTNKNDIPRCEYLALATWEQTHKESERAESPPSTPFDVAKYVHKPPAGAREPRPQAPVAPVAPRALWVPPRNEGPEGLYHWQRLNLGELESIVGHMIRNNRNTRFLHPASFLIQWAQRLHEYILHRRSLGEFPYNAVPTFSAGFVKGKITVGWYIHHETGGRHRRARATPRSITTRQNAEEDTGIGYRVARNYLEASCTVSPTFVGLRTPLGVQRQDSALRKQVLSAFVIVHSQSELDELARTISTADFQVYLGREGGEIALRPGETERRLFNDTDDLEMSVRVSPRLLVAINAGQVRPGRPIRFPTNGELVRLHYCAQEGHYAPKAYPAFYSRAPGMEHSPEETQADINASKARWKSIIEWFVRGLYKAMVDARVRANSSLRGIPRFLASPMSSESTDLARFYVDSYRQPAARLADFVVEGNYAQWENGLGIAGVEDGEYHQWVDVPFWFVEAVPR